MASIADGTQVGVNVVVNFTASDGSGSGTDSTELYVKTPESGSFVATGLTTPGTSGQITCPVP